MGLALLHVLMPADSHSSCIVPEMPDQQYGPSAHQPSSKKQWLFQHTLPQPVPWTCRLWGPEVDLGECPCFSPEFQPY